MAWIKSYQGLERHPKLMGLCADLKIGKFEAIGILHSFWWWALEYAETGDLNDIDPDLIGYAIGFKQDSPKDIIGILKDNGFIDDDNKIHNWFKYAGEYLRSKYHTSDPQKYSQVIGKTKVNRKEDVSRTILRTAQIR